MIINMMTNTSNNIKIQIIHINMITNIMIKINILIILKRIHLPLLLLQVNMEMIKKV